MELPESDFVFHFIFPSPNSILWAKKIIRKISLGFSECLFLNLQSFLFPSFIFSSQILSFSMPHFYPTLQWHHKNFVRCFPVLIVSNRSRSPTLESFFFFLSFSTNIIVSYFRLKHNPKKVDSLKFITQYPIIWTFS